MEAVACPELSKERGGRREKRRGKREQGGSREGPGGEEAG
jgi:hypothetical protein